MSDTDYTGMRLDEKAVRVLAHPLRSRLLGSLRLHGPATATELAEQLGTNTGATSYHLRALEGVGLVVDTDEGVGRRRLWRASTDFHSWTESDFADDEDARTALGWLQRDWVRQLAGRAERWLDAADAWPADWVDAMGLDDSVVLVDDAAAAERLRAELGAVLDRYRSSENPEARRIHVHQFLSPIDLDPPIESPQPRDR
ncbi:helix-turn-helix domain-containing protein [Cnuibacter physcomitrellae]|uniref:ArsR/SmtB family transcription factor n=1 Tax=Cnuibacter physcomitrellae TaxID=1619308 RepID=UPI002175DA2D|nr:helix-turn-helix domain-containing protein [Cnuibacter physcomitrellae]MCS5498622.1 helix-turn-helix domain-containing protein [Cnuibacter physcomitrellae]